MLKFGNKNDEEVFNALIKIGKETIIKEKYVTTNIKDICTTLCWDFNPNNYEKIVKSIFNLKIKLRVLNKKYLHILDTLDKPINDYNGEIAWGFRFNDEVVNEIKKDY